MTGSEEETLEGYVAPDARGLYVKSNGKWVEFIAKSEALLYLRFKDYGAQGEDVIFVTLDRQRAFEIQDDDDISDYDHLHIWSGEQVVQKWYWHYEGRWEVEWTDERAQKAGTEEADAESGSPEAEAHPEQ